MYTNAVAQATAVLLECEAFRGSSCSQKLKEKAESLSECEAPRDVRRLKGVYANAVVSGDDVVQAEFEATGGRDVFLDPSSVYLVHARELVSLQGDGDRAVMEVDRRGGQVPWILAARSNLAHAFDLGVLSSDHVAQLARDVNSETGCSQSKELPPCANHSVKAAKVTARSAVTGPGTPDIVQFRGRSPSTDSVPSPEHQLDANCSFGELLRIEDAATNRTTVLNVPIMNKLQEAEPKTKKRRYKPKVRSEKPKVSRAKKPRREKATDDKGETAAASVLRALILETSSPTLLQMKMLARHRKPQMKRRRCLKRQKRDDDVSRAEDATVKSDAPRLDASAPDEHNVERLDPSPQRSDERSAPDEHNSESLDPLQGSDLMQTPLADQESSSLVSDAVWKHGISSESLSLIEAFSSLPGCDISKDELRDVLAPLSPRPDDPPDLLTTTSARIPDGPPDFLSVPDEPPDFCAINYARVPDGSEDPPSTPRGPAISVPTIQDFTVEMPPPSPPSPCCASPWSREFSRNIATSTRRNINFDALEESESAASKEVEVRNEPAATSGIELAALIKAMAGNEESSQLAERAFSGFKFQVTDQASQVTHQAVQVTDQALQVTDQALQVTDQALQVTDQVLRVADQALQVTDQAMQVTDQALPVPVMEPVPLAVDSSRANELQIVAYDAGAKEMVVYKNSPMRKRRIRYKPKVDLDVRTLKMFKTLTIKGAEEDDSEQDKISWEQSRQQWEDRARRFISTMREVQGNRSFSRWKGSVMDSVGGAFLTQNVSDFLSSNAFMSLRARFPARRGAGKEGAENSTPSTNDLSPVDIGSSSPHDDLTFMNLKKLPLEEAKRQEHLNALFAQNVIEDVPVDEAITEALRLTLMECQIEETDANAMQGDAVSSSTILNQKSNTPDIQRPFLQPCSSNILCTPSTEDALGVTSALQDHALVPSTDAVMNDNPSSENLATSVPDSEEAGISSSLVAQDAPILRTDQNCSWTGELAVVQEKFANVVSENFSSLTVVGKEKLLATTLRMVLGKKQTTRERESAANLRELKPVKLRPQRALMRQRIENYRYRQGNVSFKLLAGEARAAWEANFVMKSQKEKWDPLRASILADESYSRDPLNEDCVDWEAVQRASVHEVADVIKNRGMNNALAGRMKAFLDRVHRDQNGSIDLEWIRKLPHEDAKAFLLSFRGVGLKSVECIRLLTLHHPSFPVDTNVGRIAVRLGWVPLEPLPEETQLHLLELYPVQAHIQQYIWPRICNLDQQTLYELHYQMITFGKVFCTKSKPNCNACPMRSECKHYASSYASAKLLLKWPEQQEGRPATIKLPTAQIESSIQHSTQTEDPCMPIIEEPRSPEPSTDCSISIPDIEDVPYHLAYEFPLVIEEQMCSLVDREESSHDLEPAEILESLPVVVEYEDVMGTTMNTAVAPENAEVVIEEFMDLSINASAIAREDTQTTTKECIVTDDFNHLRSQELILLPPHSAPAPKLKNVQRLRTVHFVYELPDNHPLLFEMDQREADDPCFYLLAIWSPDEVPATMPKISDDDASNPFASCDNDDSEPTVRGTLLIPCKTAMRGWFPLNGTYFQVNEVFADHASSIQPIDVPRTLLWALRRRFVYFSTAVSNLFRDMSQEEIKCCFQKGYVCLRAFDLTTREPKILAPRLHQSGASIVKAPVSRKGRPRKESPRTSKAPNPSVAVVTQMNSLVDLSPVITV